jgi:hypothetical protein
MPTFTSLDAGIPANSLLPEIDPPDAEAQAIYAIPSLKAWWEVDHDYLDGLAEAPSAFRWYDRKGLAEAYPRATRRPNVVENAVNGRPALQFGYGGDLTQNANTNGALECVESGIVGGNGYEFTIVYAIGGDGNADGGVLISNKRDSASQAFMIQVTPADGRIRVYHQTPGAVMVINGACPAPETFVTDTFSFDQVAGTVTVTRHGQVLGSATGVTGLSNDTGARFLSIGAVGATSLNQVFSGKVAFLTSCNAPLPTSQRNLILNRARSLYATW